MKTKFVQLLSNATGVDVTIVGDKTNITFESTVWPGKTCIYQIMGAWEFISANERGIKLANYDEIIPNNYGNKES